MSKSDIFKFSDYDCIGFDLDNTLIRYKLSSTIQLEYKALAKYLVNTKGYSAKYLEKPLTHDVDFLQRGLIIDLEKGNIVKIASNGYILKAAHGTKFMSDAEIVSIYGTERQWNLATEYTKDLLAAWNGPVTDKIRGLLDYFDMPLSLLFARIVDSLDSESETTCTTYNVWADMLGGLTQLYERKNFSTNKSEYFEAVKQHPDKYINIVDEKVLNLLKQLKQEKIVFLITGSNLDYANFTATFGLGENWKSLFDFVVCFARKPGFFNERRPFVDATSFENTSTIDLKDLKLGEVYSQGNIHDLIKVLATKRQMNADNIKLLYVGDNLVQDVYAPNKLAKCDTVAIMEEMLADGIQDYDGNHVDEEILSSKQWGSYFGTHEEPTSWCQIIRNHSKICVPTMEVIASNPIDFEYKCFTTSKFSDDGFYPGKPKFLNKL